LLIGETGIGKTKICEVVSELFKAELKTINMHSEIESADFIGQSVMVNGGISWRHGPLVDSMVNGHALLIDEINLAEDAVLERMNTLLEDRRTLYATEIAKEFRAHDRFRIVATMNPGGDYGKREISPALRNRFTEIYFQLGEDEYLDIFSRMADKAGLPAEDADYFKSMLGRVPGEMSIRRVELVVKHIANIYANNRLYAGCARACAQLSPLWARKMCGPMCSSCLGTQPMPHTAIRRAKATSGSRPTICRSTAAPEPPGSTSASHRPLSVPTAHTSVSAFELYGRVFGL